ncbi:hypothetical protein, partial [Spongiibacter tropicus]|uniref:hypothetical protein n=1 Tax=Spongiibacter tropicus TaxID=454602 RepID=UPI003009F38C
IMQRDRVQDETGISHPRIFAVWRFALSSMVEPQPSKLMVRVRFPLPAPVCVGLKHYDYAVLI